MSEAEAPSKPRTIKDRSFARRLNGACEDNAEVPPLNRGRLVWVRDTLNKRFNIEVSMEAVRRWFAGESRPRPDKMRRLAEILKVDEAWLSLGITADLTPSERSDRRIAAHGAVNLVAGHIQLASGTCVLPAVEGGDTPVDLYAIIGGRQVSLAITLANCDDAGMASFLVHKEYRRCVVIGVVVRGPMAVDFHVLPRTLIRAHGEQRGNATLLDGDISDGLSIGGRTILPIRDFQAALS